ncbi:hypothetical protein REPUB_Repub15cG0139300 [Reevesia pubescens]
MDNFDQKLGPDFFKNLSGEAITPLNVVHEDIYESSSKRPKTTSKEVQALWKAELKMIAPVLVMVMMIISLLSEALQKSQLASMKYEN